MSDAYSALDQAILEQTDAALVTQAQAFVRMGRAEDLMLQESAIISSDLAARSFPAADRQQFTQLVGARRALFSQTLPALQPSYRAYYTHDISPQASAALTTLENQLMSDTRVGQPSPGPAAGLGASGRRRGRGTLQGRDTKPRTRSPPGPRITPTARTWNSSWRAGWACSR